MAQLQWTVPGYGGRNYRVGMYHGEDSGHLMVHCNNKVMLIDFGVKDSKNYSFYLDQELFELQLKREQGRFSYDLKHNEDIDSPHNRRRQQEKKTGKWRIIASVVVLIFFAIIMIAAWSKNPNDHIETLALMAAGQGVSTEVSLYQEDGQWHANYRTEESIHDIVLPSIPQLSDLGLRLNNGDRFAGRYWPDQPDILLIDWMQPHSQTLAHFERQTMEYHASVHPELSPQQIGCQVRLAYELEGVQGLGIMLAQNQNENSKYNREDYLRFTRSTEFRQGNRACL